MNIAICLSGTIRTYENSLDTIHWFEGHNVHVYIHTWSNISDTVAQSWSHRSSLEPTKEILSQYSPVQCVIEDWLQVKPRFVADVERWTRDHNLTTFTSYGMLGMLHSLRASFNSVNPLNYDMVLRLRFDCKLLENPLDYNGLPGWYIPNGEDYWGINDQIGWYYPQLNANPVNDLQGYFNTYENVDRHIQAGTVYFPEALLLKSLKESNCQINRPTVAYKIRDR